MTILKEIEKHCLDDVSAMKRKRNARKEGNQISQKKGIVSRGHHVRYIHLHQMHMLIIITAQSTKHSNIVLTMRTFENRVDSLAIH